MRCSNRYIRFLLTIFLIFLLPYLIELVTEYLYYSHFVLLYFFFSSFRLYFFIAYFGIVSFYLGRKSSSLRTTWVLYSAALVALFSLVYVFGCSPKVCYITGIDGLEPVRAFSFFFTEGIAATTAGFLEGESLSKIEILTAKISTFYAVAYYPVVFAIAGVKLVSQISPLPVILVLVVLSFAMSVNVFERANDWRLGLIVPILTFLVLGIISIGIASQYIALITPLIAVLLTSVFVASLSGVLVSFRSAEKVRRFAKSKFLAIGLIGVILLVNVVVTPDAVAGTAPNQTRSYYFLDPVFAGGFMSDPSIGTEGVSANFSFQGTNTSSIQPNNFLSVGIGIHSPNCCVDGIDYGYRADVFLYRNATEVFAASAWEVCDVIIACGGHPWKNLIFFSSEEVNVSLEDSFQLLLMWQSHKVVWLLNYSSQVLQVASFQAPKQENAGFDAGYLGTAPPPSFGGVPFFQFGVMSAYPIGHAGWRATVSCPAILENSTWMCISHAELLQGDQSYWKALWRWGESYPGVGATINPQSKEITFQYSQQTLADFQHAW